MSKPLNGAVIGCGFFAQNQLHAWAALPGAQIVALCDRDPVRLAETASRFGIVRTYADAAEMFVAERLDFVDIATTVASHRPLVEMAAQAGVHVICQKPFAANMTDARAMVAAVEAAGKTLMVHENFRWQSAVRRVIEIVRAGTLGEVFFGRVSFRSGFDVFSGQPYLAEGKRFIIEDLGIHTLDIARALFGDVIRTAATTRRINPSINGEDVATMLLTHRSGATSVVDCSYATKRIPETFPESLIEIDGTLGSLRLDAGYQLVMQGCVEDLSPPLLAWASRPWHNIQESVLIIQRHFLECIAAGAAPETSGRDNLQTLALVEAAYLSAAEARTVDLATL
ncbi:oxidoreductase [Cypionkella aquatica]|uniref:Oxidoreductase n=1 Tax=Cypionkella aquatica TaxID=1756042 RepID=A0AA37U5Y9_9RHOB|nr:Gfo/Idh/MocA family oxidoreductase [Cypionkella aquatica]GLS88194.1 oxidoreductase [Cypionkella aquatica]